MSKATTAVAAELINHLYGLKGNDIADVCEPLSAITGHQVTQHTIDAWRAAREDAPQEVVDYLRSRVTMEENTRLH